MSNLISDRHFNIYLNTPVNRSKVSNLQSVLRSYIRIAIEIQAYLIDWEKMNNFPKINLYVPAEHDTFIQLAYLHKFITTKQVSFINCNIIHLCNLFIQFGSEELMKKQPKTEFNWAKSNHIPIYLMPDLGSSAIEVLKFTIEDILKENN